MSPTAQEAIESLVNRVRLVRRWLVVLSVLKVAAACLVFVSVYVGIYAWLDHRVHFSPAWRLAAAVILAGAVAALLVRLAKVLLGHISCSRAANHIESNSSFDQQLVTAIEYYENRHNYAYSKALAERLVLQVNEQCAGFDFSRTVDKRVGFVLLVLILFGLAATSWYIHHTGAYFYSYFSRLVHPLAPIAPLPRTTLEPLSGDIVGEPGSDVTVSAAIRGLVPESGRLVLADGNSAAAAVVDRPRSAFEVEPILEGPDAPKFEFSRRFDREGVFKYHFEAGGVSSPTHTIKICSIPQIKSITASVRPAGSRLLRPYRQDVRDYSLSVPKNSRVILNVETTQPLQRAVVTGIDGGVKSFTINNAANFDYKFTAGREGFIRFAITSTDDVENSNTPPLQVMLKPYSPPTFELLSPQGDYLATDVASIPISFKVEDDFGLESVWLNLEIADAEPMRLPMPVEKGTGRTTFRHVLELERYNLSVGDSIVFYAEATDVDMQASVDARPARSDVYFIEVRPYRRRWHQSLPASGVGKPNSPPAPPVRQEPLLYILEYTRAILKKTWAIANHQQLNDQDKQRLASINKDVQYCRQQVAGIRDLKYSFDAAAKATLSEVVRHYAAASKFLSAHQASAALGDEKSAYRVLRKFVLEREKCLCPPGGGSPPPRRDFIRMLEQLHVKRFEKDRARDQMQSAAGKCSTLASKQRKIKQDFENFLVQRQQRSVRQKVTDVNSWVEKSGGNGKPCPACGSRRPGGCPVCSQVSVEGALPPPKMGGRQAGSAGTRASAEEKLRMLQAREAALRQQALELQQQLAQLQQVVDKSGAKACGRAGTHLEKSAGRMEKFEKMLTEARFDNAFDDRKLAEALEQLASARQELQLAEQALEQGLDLGEEEALARQAQRMAEEMAELAKAFEGPLTDAQRQQMLARLERAKGLLSQMMQGSRSPGRSASGQTTAAGAQAAAQGQGAPSDHAFGTLGGYGDAGPVTKVRTPPALVARYLAGQFWSLAVRAMKKPSRLTEEGASDARFYEAENEFFESAAGYDGPARQHR